jgi:hypothetical protein
LVKKTPIDDTRYAPRNQSSDSSYGPRSQSSSDTPGRSGVPCVWAVQGELVKEVAILRDRLATQEAGLYTLNAVDHSLKAPGFNH